MKPTQKSPWEALKPLGSPLGSVNGSAATTPFDGATLHSFYGTSVCNSLTPSQSLPRHRHCLHMLHHWFLYSNLSLSIDHTEGLNILKHQDRFYSYVVLVFITPIWVWRQVWYNLMYGRICMCKDMMKGIHVGSHTCVRVWCKVYIYRVMVWGIYV